ncbi:MAG: clostripain-related cysteine peptidase [Candidatus Thermoplasmatota archaeon]|nr:clostripain-related cysteine peptidase [Candidatus Thermoplasmatota archaeon]
MSIVKASPIRSMLCAAIVAVLVSSATAVCDADTDTQAAEWTILIYLDADNDLEKVGVDDFLDMSSVGSSEDVNIVVQLDRIPGYYHSYEDWTGTMRFLVEPRMTPIPANAVMDLGELNMGDPDTLADFVSWGVTHYPAKKYSLILWDHGGGWGDYFGRAVCIDDTSRDALTMAEVETALLEATSSSGERMDVLGYDACLMAMAEVMYETIEYVDYVVASEDIVPDDGWPYDTFLADLVAAPKMSPADLSEVIVDRYMQSYGFGRPICLSAVDMTIAQEMYDAIEHFAQELILSLPDNREMIAYCRSNTTPFDWPVYVDLYQFAWNVGDMCTTSRLKIAADSLTAAVEAAVIAEEHGRKYWDLGGISIYFPESRMYYDPEGLYSISLDFTADTSWDEFLIAYLEVGGNMLPIAHMTWWPDQPEPGQEVSFSAEGSLDPDGWIIWYLWDFGDLGPSGQGLDVDTVFDQAGDYLVTLTVYDNEGECGSVSAVVTVKYNEVPVIELSVTALRTSTPDM